MVTKKSSEHQRLLYSNILQMFTAGILLLEKPVLSGEHILQICELSFIP